MILMTAVRSEDMQGKLVKIAEQAIARYEDLNREHCRLLAESSDPALAYSDRALNVKRSFQTHRVARKAFDDYRRAMTLIFQGR